MIRASHGIYLDSASGAPLHPRVVTGFMDALRSLSCAHSTAPSGAAPTESLQLLSEASSPGADSPYLLPNPNSLHQPAQRMRKVIRETAELVLASLGLTSEKYGVLFTSSGTEAVHTATRSVLQRSEGSAGSPLWLVSEVEHSCNRDLIPELERRGVRIGRFSVNDRGRTDWEALQESGATHGGLLTLMSTQNESGITSHILSAHQYAHKTSLHLCIDHVAGWGKVDLPFREIEPAFIAVSGHKIGAFAGIGALVYRKSMSPSVQPLIPGSQQGRLRGGTENTAGILSLKLALEAKRDDPEARARVQELRDRFESKVSAEFSRARINGQGADRSPYISSVTFAGESRNLDLPVKLDLQGISVSSGSACQSAVPTPSFVLLHYGLNEMDARNTLRVSLHDHSNWSDLEALLSALRRLVS